MDNTAYNEARNNGQFKIAWGNVVATYPDSDAMIYPTFHSSNIGAGGNFAVTATPKWTPSSTRPAPPPAMKSAPSSIARSTTWCSRTLPYAYLDHNITWYVCQPYVKNYCPSALDVTTYHRVWLDK